MKSKKKATIGILLASSSAIATGTFGLFVRYLGNYGLSENAITVLTPLLATIAFLIIGLIVNPKGFILEKPLYWFTVLIVSGCIAFPLYNFAYVKAFEALPLAVASLFHFTNAVVLVFLMRLFFKHKITKSKLICCAVAIVGMLLVLQVFSLGKGSDITLMGIFWGVVLATSLALSYCVDYFNISIAGVHWLNLQVYACLITTIFYSIVYYHPSDMIAEMTKVASQAGPGLWIVIAFYTLAIIVSYGAVGWSYVFIDASLSALTFVLEPTTGALLGLFVFGEKMTVLQWLGVFIAIAAIIYMQYAESKAEEQAQALEDTDKGDETLENAPE